MEHLTQTQQWIGDTLRLVRESNKPVSAICREARVSSRWFYMVERGEIREPSIVKLLRIREAIGSSLAA